MEVRGEKRRRAGRGEEGKKRIKERRGNREEEVKIGGTQGIDKEGWLKS